MMESKVCHFVSWGKRNRNGATIFFCCKLMNMTTMSVRFGMTLSWEEWTDRQKAYLQNTFRSHQVVVVSGEYGVGKSTQIPQYVLENVLEECKLNHLMVACTQTIGLAAHSLAERVRKEMGLEREQVGYVTEFEDKCCAETLLKYMTDFALVQEAVNDPSFSRYKVVIVDESEQNTLWTDALLALLKKALQTRDDLQAVIITSVGEFRKFELYFKAFSVTYNRMYEAEDCLEDNCITDYYDATSNKLEELLDTTCGTDGNIVVFLPCESDVEMMYEDFVKKLPKINVSLQLKGKRMDSVELFKLHSSLSTPPKMYKSAPSSDGCAVRKVLFATHIAETSFSIEGVLYVVDSGYTEVQIYDRMLGVEYVKKSRISKLNSARRISLGGSFDKPLKCYRMYTHDLWRALDQRISPPFGRCKLDHVVCLLKSVLNEDIQKFQLINPPDSSNMESSISDLTKLGALDALGQLTELGHKICQFPLEPAVAVIVVAGHVLGCSDGAITVASMLLVPNCFKQPKKQMKRVDEARRSFRHAGGDHLTLLNVYKRYIKECDSDDKWCEKNYLNQAALERGKALKEKVASIAMQLGLYNDACTNDYESNVKKAIFKGHFSRIAILESCGHYTTMKGQKIVHLHPSSSLEQKPSYVMFSNYVPATTRDFIQIVSDIDPDWIQTEIGPSTKCSFA